MVVFRCAAAFLLVWSAAAWGQGIEEDTLSLLTLNMAHGRALAPDQIGPTREQFEANVDAMAAVLHREKADVVALQEADAPSAWSGFFDHVQRLAEKSTYNHCHHGIHFNIGAWMIQARYGTALLSHRPLGDQTSHPFAANKMHVKGFVTATVDFGGRKLRIVSLHLDSQGPQIRRFQADELIAVLRGTDGPLVVLGDFNSRWSNVNDAVRRIAEGLKLQGYREEAGGMETFRANRPTKRIDWILISQDLEFTEYRVVPDVVSDHLAVYARIRWRGVPAAREVP